MTCCWVGLKARTLLQMALKCAFCETDDLLIMHDLIRFADQAASRLPSGLQIMQQIFPRAAEPRSSDPYDLLLGGAAGYPSHSPIFVVGVPRSGSTLVEHILSSHPEAHGAGMLCYSLATIGIPFMHFILDMCWAGSAGSARSVLEQSTVSNQSGPVLS